MNKLLFFSILLFFIIKTNMFAQRAEVLPYISFIEENNTHPVDYVFELFEKYDIVILGERDHRDQRQYELIEKIISDRRFIENIGNVFTEVGPYNRIEWANEVLKSEYESYSDFENNLRPLYRELESWNLIWEKYNFWYFLSSIYRINTKLQSSQKINLFFTDVPFDWNSINTRDDYLTFQKNISEGKRDSIMGNNMTTIYNKILNDDNSNRKKALVIYNLPHAIQSKAIDSLTIKSAASYIFNEYPGKVANVMINWLNIHNSRYSGFIADGKWDAAFWALCNPSVGFDFNNSPFGMDKIDFDYIKRPLENNVNYQDLFTGFIFYGGVTSWNIVIGIPGIIDDEFGAEFLRREKIVIPDSKITLCNAKEYYNIVRMYKVWDFGDKMSKRRIKKNYKYWIGKKIGIGI